MEQIIIEQLSDVVYMNMKTYEHADPELQGSTTAQEYETKTNANIVVPLSPQR
jgi:hypothetical protein